MYLKRNIDLELEKWRVSASRKPILMRGARQVGKSSSVRELAKKFDYFIEINFDENPRFKTIFEGDLSPTEICEKIAIDFGIPIIKGKTLLFFDEIQACVSAISSLRYFYEKMPELHLIAAGSLLEFALAETPSFGVGRVSSLFMYPFSFAEFLVANKQDNLLQLLNTCGPEKPIDEIFHNKLKSFLKKFLIIGGMPEAVNAYITTSDLLAVQKILDDLTESIVADFSKYKNSISVTNIREVFFGIVQQVGGKFSYSYHNATLTNVQIKAVIELLKMAGLVYQVTHSASNGIPIGAEINNKIKKYLIFDTGIFQRILGLNIGEILINEDFKTINKGNIAELFVGLEILKNEPNNIKNDLYYWQRESKNSQAEVDYVIQKQYDIIPIEVKSGTRGAMQSINIFINEKHSNYGIRTSIENFSNFDKIKVYPLYAIRNIFI
jgi:uncharacterized protein